VMALLATPWLDSEGKTAAKLLFEHFFAIIESDTRFNLPVVAAPEFQVLQADGKSDDTCISNTILLGTPIHFYDVKKAVPGVGDIEQASLFDVARGLACNHDRVWVSGSIRKFVSTTAPMRD
jgi:hypothetical protein